MTDNLRIWQKVCTPPAAALKKIQAGRLKGKSDINPQWRILAMTELFGPVGIGWKYSIDKLWLENGADNQVCAFAIVSVQVKEGEEWSAPVPGIGGSMLVEKEKSGMHTSDEAYKMAITDALSVAFKAFGVAGDIYMGMSDGSKYDKQPPSPPKTIEWWFNEARGPKTVDELAAWYKRIASSEEFCSLPAEDKTAINKHVGQLKDALTPKEGEK